MKERRILEKNHWLKDDAITKTLDFWMMVYIIYVMGFWKEDGLHLRRIGKNVWLGSFKGL